MNPNTISADVVIARRFVLAGPNDTQRAVLTTEEETGSTALLLYDSKQRLRVQIRVDSDCAKVQICDAAGRGRVGIAVLDSNGKSMPAVEFTDVDGKLQGIVAADTHGEVRIISEKEN